MSDDVRSAVDESLGEQRIVVHLDFQGTDDKRRGGDGDAQAVLR